jgi:hypothetical protein
MMSKLPFCLLLPLLAMAAGCDPAPANRPYLSPSEALAEIKDLHGKVTVDGRTPGRPVVGIDLSFTGATDALLPHLAVFPGLQHLRLDGTEVSDAGLVHLARLTQLKSLSLRSTKFSDAGVEHLRRMLPNCAVSFRKHPTPTPLPRPGATIVQ